MRKSVPPAFLLIARAWHSPNQSHYRDSTIRGRAAPTIGVHVLRQPDRPEMCRSVRVYQPAEPDS
jgi:hypothetical protein